MGNKAVFLDRDGTINIDVHYLDNPENFQLYSNVGNCLGKLKDAGYMLIVITNQSGIGRGYFTEQQLSRIHERMQSDLSRFGVVLDDIYYCPHLPEDNCACRKPRTGLFEAAIRDHDVDPTRSFMIGDKILDIEAGYKVGVRTILVPEPSEWETCLANESQWQIHPDYIATDFMDGVAWLLKNT